MRAGGHDIVRPEQCQCAGRWMHVRGTSGQNEIRPTCWRPPPAAVGATSHSHRRQRGGVGATWHGSDQNGPPVGERDSFNLSTPGAQPMVPVAAQHEPPEQSKKRKRKERSAKNELRRLGQRDEDASPMNQYFSRSCRRPTNYNIRALFEGQGLERWMLEDRLPVQHGRSSTAPQQLASNSPLDTLAAAAGVARDDSAPPSGARALLQSGRPIQFVLRLTNRDDDDRDAPLAGPTAAGEEVTAAVADGAAAGAAGPNNTADVHQVDRAAPPADDEVIIIGSSDDDDDDFYP